MKVAIETTMAMSHGLRLPADDRDCGLPPATSAHLHARHHRHSGAQIGVGRLVEHDLHGYALHDLDIVPGRVFRRKQAEGRAAAGLDTLNVAFKYAAWIGIDGDLDLLAGAHRGK